MSFSGAARLAFAANAVHLPCCLSVHPRDDRSCVLSIRANGVREIARTLLGGGDPVQLCGSERTATWPAVEFRFATAWEFDAFCKLAADVERLFGLRQLQETLERDVGIPVDLLPSYVPLPRDWLPTHPGRSERSAIGGLPAGASSHAGATGAPLSFGGPNVSDAPLHAATCHTCHKGVPEVLLCNRLEDDAARRSRSHGVCKGCLARRTGESFDDIMAGAAAYQCIVCTGRCGCAGCRGSRYAAAADPSAATEAGAGGEQTPGGRAALGSGAHLEAGGSGSASGGRGRGSSKHEAADRGVPAAGMCMPLTEGTEALLGARKGSAGGGKTEGAAPARWRHKYSAQPLWQLWAPLGADGVGMLPLAPLVPDAAGVGLLGAAAGGASAGDPSPSQFGAGGADCDAGFAAGPTSLLRILVEGVAGTHRRCILCLSTESRATSRRRLVGLHPLVPLRQSGCDAVLLCEHCHALLITRRAALAARGELLDPEDGYETVCALCGVGGPAMQGSLRLSCCSGSRCPRSYCSACVPLLLTAKEVRAMDRDAEWLCPPCHALEVWGSGARAAAAAAGAGSVASPGGAAGDVSEAGGSRGAGKHAQRRDSSGGGTGGAGRASAAAAGRGRRGSLPSQQRRGSSSAAASWPGEEDDGDWDGDGVGAGQRSSSAAGPSARGRSAGKGAAAASRGGQHDPADPLALVLGTSSSGRVRRLPKHLLGFAAGDGGADEGGAAPALAAAAVEGQPVRRAAAFQKAAARAAAEGRAAQAVPEAVPAAPPMDAVAYFSAYAATVRARCGGLGTSGSAPAPPAPAASDDECCVCRDGGDVFECDFTAGGSRSGGGSDAGGGLRLCPKVYHAECLGFSVPEDERWECPRHKCRECGRPALVLCRYCPNSLCAEHTDQLRAVKQQAAATTASADAAPLRPGDRPASPSSGAPLTAATVFLAEAACGSLRTPDLLPQQRLMVCSTCRALRDAAVARGTLPEDPAERETPLPTATASVAASFVPLAAAPSSASGAQDDPPPPLAVPAAPFAGEMLLGESHDDL